MKIKPNKKEFYFTENALLSYLLCCTILFCHLLVHLLLYNSRELCIRRITCKMYENTVKGGLVVVFSIIKHFGFKFTI